jgi:hypothetical protein
MISGSRRSLGNDPRRAAVLISPILRTRMMLDVRRLMSTIISAHLRNDSTDKLGLDSRYVHVDRHWLTSRCSLGLE